MEIFSSTLLGGVAFSTDGVPIPSLPTRTEQAMLVYLLYYKRPLTRDMLVSIFYPESDPAQGRKNLRTALTRIKSKVGDLLLVEGEDVCCRSDLAIDLDTERFETGLATVSAENLQSILDSYHGDFMAGFFLRTAPEFEQWQTVMRERLRMLVVQGYGRLIEQLENSAEFTKALDAASRLLAIEPLDENTHYTKMLLLARTGNRAASLQHYTRAEHLLDEQLGCLPAQPLQTLRQRIAHLNDEVPHHLPTQRNQFVGRVADIDQLIRRLGEPENRLITLLGMGGMGKTRLAIELAYKLRKRVRLFLDGLFFVSLEEVDSAENFIVTIASVLGLQLQSGATAQSQLFGYLAERELLLILDNFESVVDNRAILATLKNLLAHAPTVKLLVTSREQLNIPEETRYVLDGLAHTDSSQQSDAVTLFLSCAQRHRGDLIIDADALADIATACRLLDGIPLALELAAGWVRQQSTADIVSNIEADRQFLKTQMRNVPQRHRSLQLVLQQSWQRLSHQQRRTLVTIAVFHGGLTVDAARVVCATTKGALNDLLARALLTETGGRYRLHETIRPFAAAQVTTIDGLDWAALELAHADYFAQQATAWEMMLDGVDERRAVREISADWDNLRSAFRFAIIDRNAEFIRAMMRPLHEFSIVRGLGQLVVPLFAQAALVVDDPVLQGLLNLHLALQLVYYDDFQKADQLIANALPQCETGTQLDRAQAYLLTCYAYHLLQRYELAQQYAEQALALFRAEGHLPGEAMAALRLSSNSYFRNLPFAETAHLAQIALTLLQQAGLQRAAVFAHFDLARAFANQRKITESIEHGQAMLSLSEQIDYIPGQATAYDVIGLAYVGASDWENAALMYEKAAEVFLAMGQVSLSHNSWGMLAVVEIHNGNPERGRQLLEARLAYPGTVRPLAIAFTERWLALALMRLGQVQFARTHLQVALKLSGDHRIQARQTVDSVKIAVEYLLQVGEFALAARAVQTLSVSAGLEAHHRQVELSLKAQLSDGQLAAAIPADNIWLLSAEISTLLQDEGRIGLDK